MPNKAFIKKEHIVYHKDGSVWAKGKMLKGVCDGYWEWIRKPDRASAEGVIMRSGHFKKGKKVGEWITYDKKGEIYKVKNFKTI